MKPPVKLRLDLLPSRQAIALVTVAYVATAALAASLPADAWLRAAAVIVIGWRGVAALRHWATRTTRDAAVTIEVAADRHTAIVWGDGRRSEGFVTAETYVGETVTSIVWRGADSRRSRAIALLPDMARPDDLRKLRVLLRYSRRSQTGAPGKSEAPLHAPQCIDGTAAWSSPPADPPTVSG